MIVVPASMGQLNKRELLNQLQMRGAASRASLARLLGLSQPTTGKIVEQLLKAGIMEEVNGEAASVPAPGAEATPAKAGRPPRWLRLDRRHKRFLAIQLGVTNTSIASLPLGVEPEDQWELQLPPASSARHWLAQLKQVAGMIGPREFWAVLVSVPGVVDEPKGRVLFSPNLHWSEGAQLPALIQSVWSAPVVLVQEERALALGQQMAEPSEEGFLLVDFGEGVGAAVVVRGRLQVNPLPVNGELGHTPVFQNQRRCGCGATGCLETLVSTRGLLQSFAEASQRKQPAWPTLVQHVAKCGVPAWLAQTLDQTAMVIAGALNILGLQQVVISGSLLDFHPAVFQHLAQAISRGAIWSRFGNIEVKRAPRRRIAGLIAVGLERLVWSPPPGKRRHAKAFVKEKPQPSRSANTLRNLC
jgi:predicted NBD/HSP70 family sugar kinase